MIQEIRDAKQEEFVKTGLFEKDLIMNISIRLGKTRIALRCIEPGEKVLVVYPLATIKDSWIKEMEICPPASTDITFVTKSSVHKYKDQTFDTLIIDEPQMCQSAKQIDSIKSIKYKKRIGLTGLLNGKTIRNFREELKWEVKIKYTMEDAIDDGLVKDYRIYLHMIELNEVTKVPYEKYGRTFWDTEKNIYTEYTEGFEQAKAEVERLKADKWSDPDELIKQEGLYQFFMSRRTNFLYNCDTLLSESKDLVKRYKNQKVLIYSMRTDIADYLSDISYHSKNKDQDVLDYFKSSMDGHLAVCNSISAGVTIKNLNRVIFHSYESNSETFTQKLGRSLLYEYNLNQSSIHIFAIKDTQMEEWCKSGIKDLNVNKIAYVYKNVPTGYHITPLTAQTIKDNPDKELYVYDKRTFVYFVGTKLNGSWNNRMYAFLGSPPEKSYPLRHDKLQKL